MRPIVLVLLVSCFSLNLNAQNASTIEIFGGYSLLHLSSPSGVQWPQMDGWNASATVYFKRWLGATADFRGAYGTQITEVPDVIESRVHERNHTFMFGPQLAYKNSRYQPFGHALFGFDHINATVTTTGLSGCTPSNCSFLPLVEFDQNSFAMALGGGLDIQISRKIAIRVAQVELQRLRAATTPDVNHFRYSGGVVFRFGNKQ